MTIISYKKGYKYKLCGNITRQTTILQDKDINRRYISLNENGLLTVKSGYCWDGATGAIDTKTIMRASLIHDALCQLINNKIISKTYQILSDKELYDICIEDGMSKVRAWWIYHAVRHFDKSGLKKYEPKEVLSAP